MGIVTPPTDFPEPTRRRATDSGLLCRIALRTSQLWDFVDKRQLDAHLVVAFTLWVSYRITTWGMEFAYLHAEKGGSDAALIIAAVGAPWALLQAAVVKFTFDARKASFE